MSNYQKSRVVLSFDDGRLDNYTNVMPLLFKYSFCATFNITSAYIDRSLKAENKFCDNDPMSIADVREIASTELFEVALHGDQHLNSYDDIQIEYEKFKTWGITTPDSGFGFASPHHQMGKWDIQSINEWMNKNGLKYVRIGASNIDKRIGNRLLRVLARITQNSFLFVHSFKHSLVLSQNTRVYYSIPYNKKISIEELKGIIKYSIKKHCDCILLFHSVIKKEEEHYCNMENIDYEDFCTLCDFLFELRDKGYIEICKNEDLLKPKR